MSSSFREECHSLKSGSLRFYASRMDIGTVEEFVPVLTRQVEALRNDIPNYTNVEPVIQFEEVL